MLRYGVADVLDGEAGKLEIVTICVNEFAMFCIESATSLEDGVNARF